MLAFVIADVNVKPGIRCHLPDSKRIRAARAKNFPAGGHVFQQIVDAYLGGIKYRLEGCLPGNCAFLFSVEEEADGTLVLRKPPSPERADLILLYDRVGR